MPLITAEMIDRMIKNQIALFIALIGLKKEIKGFRLTKTIFARHTRSAMVTHLSAFNMKGALPDVNLHGIE
jgi:hypothetical protein